ncbi:hypothetical protein [Shewanella violacea]|nr:hypothetical protein [Shewanella violacea]
MDKRHITRVDDSAVIAGYSNVKITQVRAYKTSGYLEQEVGLGAGSIVNVYLTGYKPNI